MHGTHGMTATTLQPMFAQSKDLDFFLTQPASGGEDHTVVTAKPKGYFWHGGNTQALLNLGLGLPRLKISPVCHNLASIFPTSCFPTFCFPNSCLCLSYLNALAYNNNN